MFGIMNQIIKTATGYHGTAPSHHQGFNRHAHEERKRRAEQELELLRTSLKRPMM
ncbi:hypothetical protein [Thioclava sp. SK-1]|uniref:hypothetical protein n=1 Tax=Thioclava sp. SK-1 TaxID=1889770 RepID=UPI00159F0A52|nr:hypothetical protein [Thioclava sp. SK-1]